MTSLLLWVLPVPGGQRPAGEEREFTAAERGRLSMTERVEAVDQARQSLMQAVTGLVVIGGAAFPTAAAVVVICGNDQIHHARIVRDFAAAHPGLHLWLGTRYNPHDNPAERIWAGLKAFVPDTAVTWPGRRRQVHAYFRARSPDQLPATASPTVTGRTSGKPLSYFFCTSRPTRKTVAINTGTPAIATGLTADAPATTRTTSSPVRHAANAITQSLIRTLPEGRTCSWRVISHPHDQKIRSRSRLPACLTFTLFAFHNRSDDLFQRQIRLMRGPADLVPYEETPSGSTASPTRLAQTTGRDHPAVLTDEHNHRNSIHD